MQSKVKVSLSMVVIVMQAPLIAMESPIFLSSNGRSVWMAKVLWPSLSRMFFTVPVFWIIPVNIVCFVR